MNILHLNDKIEISGGVEVYIQQLLELLPQYAIQAHWLGINETNEKYNIKSYLAESENQSNLSFIELIKYLKEYISRNNIDIIHIHSLSNPKLIEACFKLAPVVRSMHEPRIVCPGQGKFWRKSEKICSQPFGLHCFYHAYKEGCCNRHPKRLIKAYRNVQFETSEGMLNYKAIFAMSNYMIEEGLKVGFSINQLVYNPYFTRSVDESRMVNQSEMEIKSLIFVGRLSRTKGVHYFIECGIRLLEEGYSVHLDIVGDGYDLDYFKNLVPENIKEHFTFHGWQSRERINELLNKSYLMIFPSIYPEAFGISGIEAMMRGKPVIGFDVGGVSTWLKDGETGYLVKVKHLNDLVERTKSLLIDKIKYQEFSEKSRDLALSKFSAYVHMVLLKETYLKILNN